MKATPRTVSQQAGFTIIDMLMVIAILGIMMAIAAPGFLTMVNQYRLGMSVRDVERELQFARLKAVATQTPMRVRFDCPAPGQLRVVELIGTPANPDPADSAADRCSETKYPYLPTGGDNDRLTRPNNDGAVRRLQTNVSFTQAATLEFWPNGTVHTPCTVACAGGPPQIATATISLTRANVTKNITVNGLGKIQMDR